MSATQAQATKNSVVLHLAFEMGDTKWQLFFTTGIGQDPRVRSIPAGNFDCLALEIAKAKTKFALPAETPVVSCYEAGREGFYVHRELVVRGIANVVVDSASIEVNRRQRRAKSDRIDGLALARLLVRYQGGERKVWRVVQVPSFEDEHRRHLHRHLNQLKSDRLALGNQIASQLLLVGIRNITIKANFQDVVANLTCADGRALPDDLRRRVLADFERWRLVNRQILDYENDRKRRIRNDTTPGVDKVRRMLMLKGIGLTGSWTLIHEVFGWRKFGNRKQVGALAGMTPTPYDSGASRREQGISKAGSARVRWLMVELAWTWVRHQPNSELTKWYRRRWDQNSRLRKIGIVAVGRKLLIALWRYVERGEIPAGAETVTWREKLRGEAQSATQTAPEAA